MTVPWKDKRDDVNAFENPHGPRLNAQGTTNALPTIVNRFQTLIDATTKEGHTQTSSYVTLARIPPSRTTFMTRLPQLQSLNVATNKGASCAHLSLFVSSYRINSPFICFSIAFVPHSSLLMFTIHPLYCCPQGYNTCPSMWFL